MHDRRKTCYDSSRFYKTDDIVQLFRVGDSMHYLYAEVSLFRIVSPPDMETILDILDDENRSLAALGIKELETAKLIACISIMDLRPS